MKNSKNFIFNKNITFKDLFVQIKKSIMSIDAYMLTLVLTL